MIFLGGPAAHGQSGDFFPDSTQFNDEIPSPGEFLGRAIGARHTRHARIVAYFRMLARRSDRISVTEIGKTNELKSMIFGVVTAPGNHANLDSLRRQHLRLTDPSTSAENLTDQPIVVQLGYGVHGDEPSSSEVAMLQAYHLVAGQSPAVQRYLKEGIFLIEPSLNPDGRDRHTQWVNVHRGSPPVADPLDREHNERWPSGRTNHYWFDLNRDWFPLAQVESRHRIDYYHQWRPNVVTDFHEMGTGSTYFFEPTEPVNSWNQLVPDRVYTELTSYFTENWAEALDRLRTPYFTGEVFDNSYPGYGSTYPNMQGGIGFVFEQASSRGHRQRSETRTVTFPYTIRNHLRNSLATVKTAVEKKEVFLRHQRKFFSEALSRAEDFPTDAYVFGHKQDTSRVRAFLDLLLQHEIDAYELDGTYSADGTTYKPGSAYVVPTQQPQYLMVRSMFEKTTSFPDSTFYDTSAWSAALSYGLPHAAVQDGPVPRGAQVSSVPKRRGLGDVPRPAVAYLLDWSDYQAAEALSVLHDHDLTVKTAYEPFEINTHSGTRKYPRGTVQVPVQPQTVAPDSLHRIVERAEQEAEINIQAAPTSLSREGVDLGSGDFEPLGVPAPLMLVGEGTSAYEAGEVWHLLDTRVGMPITKVDHSDFDRIDLPEYNTMVLVSGTYDFLEEEQIRALRRWVESDGTLITIRGATEWAVEEGLTNDPALADTSGSHMSPGTTGNETTGNETAGNETVRYDYATAEERSGAQRIGGSIYEVDLDRTHPLAFGLAQDRFPVYRNHDIFLPPTENPYSTVAQYTDEPRLSGYVSEENLQRIEGSGSLLVDQIGDGRIVLFVDNPNFRGMWYGTSRLFLNALFFGNTIDVPVAPGYE
ncbi:M14 family zinc carboxypeptidase [Salinibacter altiplanensis]|uniref:M14 family zinc carboxypeptidase n=1 Tax=Salinibacter altiplanensis TaxID=1803181 RepID=UPI0018F87701|nr:M14 family metallopeptidase [Salinibacter altiplanensis]